ncbi:MAG: hypothetical protein WC931_02165 [Bacilli bacterium]
MQGARAAVFVVRFDKTNVRTAVDQILHHGIVVRVAGQTIPAQADHAAVLVRSKNRDELLEFRPIDFVADRPVFSDVERVRFIRGVTLDDYALLDETGDGDAGDDKPGRCSEREASADLVLDRVLLVDEVVGTATGVDEILLRVVYRGIHRYGC